MHDCVSGCGAELDGVVAGPHQLRAAVCSGHHQGPPTHLHARAVHGTIPQGRQENRPQAR